MDMDQAWRIIFEYEIATEEELKLVTSINGYKLESLESIIYTRTGLNSINQLVDDLEIDLELEE